jgi:hypothetical protein
MVNERQPPNMRSSRQSTIIIADEIIEYCHTPEEFNKWIKEAPEKLFTVLEEALIDRDDNAKELQAISQELQTTKERIQTLENENIENAEEIASVTSINRDLNTQRKLLQDMVKDQSGNQGPTSSKALPDPDKFNGTTEPEFDGWLSRIKKKINSDLRNYSTDEQKIAYVQSRLTGRADDLTCHRFDDDSQERYTTINELYNHLIDLFRDKNKSLNAIQAYRKLRQYKTPFAEFYTEFLSLAGKGNIPESVWKQDLVDKMSIELEKQTLREQTDNTITYSKLAEICTTLDHQIRKLQEKSTRISNYNKQQNKGTENQNQQNNDTASITNTQQREDPKIKYTFEERRAHAIARQANTKCYNCYQMGHLSKYCLEPDRRLNQGKE